MLVRCCLPFSSMALLFQKWAIQSKRKWLYTAGLCLPSTHDLHCFFLSSRAMSEKILTSTCPTSNRLRLPISKEIWPLVKKSQHLLQAEWLWPVLAFFKLFLLVFKTTAHEINLTQSAALIYFQVCFCVSTAWLTLPPSLWCKGKSMFSPEFYKPAY